MIPVTSSMCIKLAETKFASVDSGYTHPYIFIPVVDVKWSWLATTLNPHYEGKLSETLIVILWMITYCIIGNHLYKMFFVTF